MKILKLYVLLQLIALITQTSCKRSECVSHKHTLPKEKIPNSPRPNIIRNLQEQESKPMRITFDFTRLEGMDPNMRKNLENQLLITRLYLQNIIKVYPETQNLEVTDWCNNEQVFKVSKQDIESGIPDSDLHIYVDYQESDEGWLAYAYNCQTIDDRPSVGVAMFNSLYMETADKRFHLVEELQDTVVHEIFHVLGFISGNIKYFHNPNYDGGGNKYMKNHFKTETIRGLETLVLSSPYVLAETKRHFNCPTATGMQLENQGGDGSMNQHWEKSILFNEFMVADAIDMDAQYTQFSLAFLKDTNWYADIDLSQGENSPWGEGKGCDFLMNTCANNEYPEFDNNQAIEGFSGCSFFGHAITYEWYNGDSNYDENECYIGLEQEERDCRNSNDGEYINYGGNVSRLSMCHLLNLGSGGIIFNLTYQDKASSCYKTTCLSDGTMEIIIKDKGGAPKIITCNQNSEVHNFGSNWVEEQELGQDISLICPNIAQYCRMPRPCLNYCSKNGYCRNEVCTCLPEWTGEDCSQVSNNNEPDTANETGIAILSLNKIVLFMIIILYIY